MGRKKLSVFENAPTWKQQQLCPRAQRGTDPRKCQEPPGTCVPSSRHCDPRGCGAPWVCQPILFNKSFLSVRAFLPVFLAKRGHCLGCPFPRNLSIALSGQELFAAMILSNPPCLWRKCRADLECIFDLGDVFQGLMSRLPTTEQVIPVVIAVLSGVAATRTSCLSPRASGTCMSSPGSFLFCLIKFTF